MYNVTLVDSANVLLRSVYAVANSPGISSAYLTTFVGLLAKYARLTAPSKLMTCWDSGYSEFRLNLLPEYKGKRVHSDEPSEIFNTAKELVSALGLEQTEFPGIEADDIIAEYVKMYKDQNVYIISSDKDFSQLLSENVSIYHPGDNSPFNYERWQLNNTYTPEQYVKIMALTGDKVDNICGVGGVGIKTAVKLLTQADWSIEKLLSQQPSEFKSDIFIRNLALVDLRSGYVKVTPPPIGWFNPTEPDDDRWPNLVKLLDKYRMRMTKHQILQGEFWE